MKILFENFHLHINDSHFQPGKPTILFIHGFTGSSKDWDQIISKIDKDFSCFAIDLIGHGKSSSPKDINHYEIDSMTEQIKSILGKLKLGKVIIAGYSMGGRVSLNFAARFPQSVSGLILESTTAGIKNDQERLTRYENDKILSEKILNNGIEEFVQHWINLPIFESQKSLSSEKQNKIRENKLQNNVRGLANSLIGFGAGKMIPLWEELGKFDFPVLLITGELDKKYCQLNHEMAKRLPKSELRIVKDAGHNIHLEKPAEFVILVSRFLRTIFS